MDAASADYLSDIIDITNVASIKSTCASREARAIIPKCGRGGPPPKVTDFKIPKEFEYLVPGKFKSTNVAKSPPPKVKGRGRITLYQQENQQCLNLGIRQQCEQLLGESHRNDAMVDLDRYRNDEEECDDPVFNVKLRKPCKEDNIAYLKTSSAKIRINPLAPPFVPKGRLSGGMTDVLPKSNLVPEQFYETLNCDECDVVNGHSDALPVEETISNKITHGKLLFNPAAPVFTPRNKQSQLPLELTMPNPTESKLQHEWNLEKDVKEYSTVSSDTISGSAEEYSNHEIYSACSVPMSEVFRDTSLVKTLTTAPSKAAHCCEDYSGTGSSSGSDDESSSTLVRSGGSISKSDSDTLTSHSRNREEDENAPPFSSVTKTLKGTVKNRAYHSYDGGARPKSWNKNPSKKSETEISCIQPGKSIYGNCNYNEGHLMDAFGKVYKDPPLSWDKDKDFPELNSSVSGTQQNFIKSAHISTGNIADLEPIDEGCGTEDVLFANTSSHCVIVENLSQEHNRDVLMEMLSGCGTIRDIRIQDTPNGYNVLINVAEEEVCNKIISCLDNAKESVDSNNVLKITKANNYEMHLKRLSFL